MTAAEVLNIAKSLEPTTSHPWTESGQVTALQTLASLSTVKAKQAVIKSLLASAEAYRPKDYPGHSTWYEHYVRAAAWAVERWGTL